MGHFIPPVSECLLADTCNHTWIPQCGKESQDLKQFSDDCQRHEYNCDNKKEYTKMDNLECDRITMTTVSTTTNTESTTTTTPITTFTTSVPTTNVLATTITTPATTTTAPTTTTTPATTTAATTTTLKTTFTTTTTSLPEKATTPTALTIPTLTTTTKPRTTTTADVITTYTLNPVNHNCSRTIPPASPRNCLSNTTAADFNNTVSVTSTTEATITTKAQIITTTTQTTTTTELTTAIPTTTVISTTKTEPKDINENTLPQKETRKPAANVTCALNVQNGCDIPTSWETTVKGERRDFFQILRERYGGSVKMLRATTHWPRRAGWTKSYNKSFLFGRHVDINRNYIKK